MHIKAFCEGKFDPWTVNSMGLTVWLPPPSSWLGFTPTHSLSLYCIGGRNLLVGWRARPLRTTDDWWTKNTNFFTFLAKWRLGYGPKSWEKGWQIIWCYSLFFHVPRAAPVTMWLWQNKWKKETDIKSMTYHAAAIDVHLDLPVERSPRGSHRELLAAVDPTLPILVERIQLSYKTPSIETVIIS